MTKRQPKFKAIVANQWKPEQKGDTIEGTIVNQYQKVLTDAPVPFLQIVDDDGEITEIIMGTYALEKLYYSGACQNDYYIAIRFDGEHPTIKNANNHLKMFSYYIETPEGNPVEIPSQVDIGGPDPYGLNTNSESTKPKYKTSGKNSSKPTPDTNPDIDFETPREEPNEQKTPPITK